MASRDCLLDAVKALRESDLSEAEKSFVETAINRVLDDTRLTPEQRAAKATQIGLEARRRHFIEQVTNKVADDQLVEWRRKLDALPEGERANFLRNFVEPAAGDDALPDFMGVSLASRINAELRVAAGELKPIFDRYTLNWRPYLGYTAELRDLHLELAAGVRGRSEPVSGSRTAFEDAVKIASVQDRYLERLRKAGIYVGQQQSDAPQNWNPSALRNMTAEERADFVRRLDPEHHPDAETSFDVIRESLLTRDLVRVEEKPISMGRKVFFRTPEDAVEMQMKYSATPFIESLHTHLRTLTRNTILAEEVGANPAKILGTVIDAEMRAARAAGTKAGDRAVAALHRTRERIFPSVTGALWNPLDPEVAMWGSAARQYASGIMLGWVPVWQVLQDVPSSIFRTWRHTGGLGSSLTETMRAYADVLNPEIRRVLAEELGIWEHALALESSGRRYSIHGEAERLQGAGARVASFTHRVSGFFGIEKLTRSGAGAVINRALARNLRDFTWNDLGSTYRRVLQNNGIHKAQWDAARSSLSVNKYGGVNFAVMPDPVRADFLAFVHREVDGSILRPSHLTRSLLSAGGRAGSPAGEVMSIATQFLSWPIEFALRVMYPMLRHQKPQALAFSTAMMASGMMQVQIQAALRGEPLHPWDDGEFVYRAAVRSGLLTPLGEFIVGRALGPQQRQDLGPAVAIPSAILDAVGSTFLDAVDPMAQANAGKLVRAMERTAVPNIWWAEGTLIRPAFDAVMWEIDPQYMVRRQRRLMQRELGR